MQLGRRPFTAALLGATVASSGSVNDHDANTAGTNMKSTLDLSKFGTALFNRVLSGEPAGGNVLLSPLSVARSLALAASGATPGSDAEVQLLGALGASGAGEVPRLAAELLSSSRLEGEAGGGGVDLKMASSVWTAGVKDGFVETVRSVHAAQAEGLPETYAPLNDWIEEETDGSISAMFDPEKKVDPLTRALLVDAVRFKGSWTQRFDPDKTKAGTFTAQVGTDESTGAPVGEEREAQFMNEKRKMKVRDRMEQLGDAAVLRLDYGEAPVAESDGSPPSPLEYCALLVLPSDPSPGAMTKAAEGLESTPLSQVLDGLWPRDVVLSLPKFRLDWGTSTLVPALRSMGVKAPFDGTGMFEPMSDDPDVHLDDVLHKAAIEVTEEGTVAAAATVGVIMSRSLPPPPLELTFDRPFLMAILHVPTKTPLFLGRVSDPELQ